MRPGPGRQPPHFVPTLTEVVRADPVPVSAQTAPTDPEAEAAASGADAATEQLVDRITDRVLAAVMHRLEVQLAERVQGWWQLHAQQCAQDVARSLLDDTAGDLRDAVADALSAEVQHPGA